MLTVLSGEIPDCVPVSPDVSNMIPARMTGLPFWDIYLYQKVPQWKAYIDCVRHFGFDALMDGYVRILFDELGEIDRDAREAIVMKNEDRIITRKYRKANGRVFWENTVSVYFRDNPPVRDIDPARVGANFTPNHFDTVEVQNPYAGIEGEALLKLVKDEMGEHGLVGVWCGRSTFVTNTDQIYAYYDDPEPFIEASKTYLEKSVTRFKKLMSLKIKPDFICTGGSGTLVYQTVDMFRALGLPIVKTIAQLCSENGIPSHVHSCGPEKELVRICYEETKLTVIDPLEVPPMGNCDLKLLKKQYGDRLVLKGNLHTTDVMLRGSAEDVRRASRLAIDDAAEGGRFILSTGDQCGRDTPDENIFAMIETARSYGKYR
ncbi:MAG: hypothetical protein K5663_02230 [Clostridiales bacterium]|nr:hypothetical protein [Clostridiales bacterium]